MTSQDRSVYDVAIIGAGPAGSVLALVLARSGLSVALLDQSEFPRRKVCGGCLNGNAMAALQQCGLGDLPKSIGAKPVERMQLRCGNRGAELTFQNNWSVSRTRFDLALIEQSQMAGVTFLPGQRATMGEVAGEFRHVQLHSKSYNASIAAKIVVVAHGLKEGTIARDSRLGVGAILPRAPQSMAYDGLMMVVGRGGYVGGVCVEDGQYDLAAALDVDFLKAQGTIANAVCDILHQSGITETTELAAADWKGTPLLTRRPTEIAGERWFAVGDAAGYVEPFTGEGMAWAMNGAIELAPVVQQAVVSWHPELSQVWSRLHQRKIARRQWLCRLLSRVLRSPRLSQGLVTGLKRFPGIARPVLRQLSRPTQGIAGVIE